MAVEDRGRPTQAGMPTRHWRWRGVLTDYLTAEPPSTGDGTAADGRAGEDDEDDGRPAILLVHGFGAFSEQWRGQVQVRNAFASFRQWKKCVFSSRSAACTAAPPVRCQGNQASECIITDES